MLRMHVASVGTGRDPNSVTQLRVKARLLPLRCHLRFAGSQKFSSGGALVQAREGVLSMAKCYALGTGWKTEARKGWDGT